MLRQQPLPGPALLWCGLVLCAARGVGPSPVAPRSSTASALLLAGPTHTLPHPPAMPGPRWRLFGRTMRRQMGSSVLRRAPQRSSRGSRSAAQGRLATRTTLPPLMAVSAVSCISGRPAPAGVLVALLLVLHCRVLPLPCRLGCSPLGCSCWRGVCFDAWSTRLASCTCTPCRRPTPRRQGQSQAAEAAGGHAARPPALLRLLP